MAMLKREATNIYGQSKTESDTDQQNYLMCHAK